MRVLIFGGSFNPVHWGHLLLAEEIAEEFSFDRVIFVPAWRSPFKDGREDPGPERRLAMLEAACRDNPRFSVDDREIRRGGPSYTIDTVRELRSELGLESPPGLLLGDDLLAGLEGWREVEALGRESRIIVARRGGAPESCILPCERASNRLIPLASSEIRARVAAGKSLRYLVPGAVADYIREKALYGA